MMSWLLGFCKAINSDILLMLEIVAFQNFWTFFRSLEGETRPSTYWFRPSAPLCYFFFFLQFQFNGKFRFAIIQLQAIRPQQILYKPQQLWEQWKYPGIILCMRPANERSHYIVIWTAIEKLSSQLNRFLTWAKACYWHHTDYKNPLHLNVVDRYLRRMGDKTIPDSAEPRLELFYPPFVAGIDLPQSRCCGFYVSFKNKHT